MVVSERPERTENFGAGTLSRLPGHPHFDHSPAEFPGLFKPIAPIYTSAAEAANTFSGAHRLSKQLDIC
jgi:hypothetical protein